MLLKNKVALVTGAGQGIGEAIAKIYAKIGAKVVVADHNEETGNKVVNDITAAGGVAAFVKVDVTKEAEVINMVKFAIEKFGRLDCACNNAGTTSTPCLVKDMDEKEFDRICDLNVNGVLLCMREEIKAMHEVKGGTIVNISSTSGIIGSPYMTPYNTSKHALIGLSKSAALEECKNNIRINTVCPGATATPLVKQQDPVAIEKFCSQIPIGRMATPEEIANVVIFLSSDLSTYMIGATVVVDGGVTIQ